MTHATLLALIAFALVSSITPGPNNLMLMSSGDNFCVRRTVPHALGITIGFTVMIALVGIGLIGLFDLWPMLGTILKISSIAYLLWLAWKIAHAASPEGGIASDAKPMSFIGGALFQWVNPKAWTMALSAITLYAPQRDGMTILLIAVIFGLVNLPSVSLWAMMGQVMRQWLSSPRRLRMFNWSMAALLVASLAPMLRSA